MSHAEFLRDLWEDDAADVVGWVRALRGVGQKVPTVAPRAVLSLLDETLTELSGLSAADLEVIRFGGKLTLDPGSVSIGDHDRLRGHGFDDRSIHDIVQVVACFAYMNRLADGTGVTLLPARAAWAAELFGDDALMDHLAWGTGR